MRVRFISASKRVPFCTSVALATLMGCSHPPKNTLHVKSVTPDAEVDVTGTLNGKVYALSVDRKSAPFAVAYYEPIDVPDVGKDFPAQIEVSSGEVVVQVPHKGTVRYSIKSVHEKN